MTSKDKNKAGQEARDYDRKAYPYFTGKYTERIAKEDYGVDVKEMPRILKKKTELEDKRTEERETMRMKKKPKNQLLKYIEPED